jgi:predicted small integral membrane protein
VDIFESLDLPRTLLLAGVTTWLWIAVFNNVRDRGTNVLLLGLMFGMGLLKEDPELGNGLKHRAIDSPKVPAIVLTFIVVYQVATAALLSAATAAMGARLFGPDIGNATALANMAVSAFTVLWFSFFCGGLWFGYWLKQGPVQQVHMTLILFSMGLFVIVNLPG